MVDESSLDVYIDPYSERELPSSTWYTNEIANDSLGLNWAVNSSENATNFEMQLEFKNYSAIS